MARIQAVADDQTATIQPKRPRFSDLWGNYPVGMAAGDVYKLVGGNAYELYKEKPNDYANACALRLSRAFNYGGLSIGKGGALYKIRGGDGKAYILRVNDIIRFIEVNFGEPDFSVQTHGQDRRADFHGKKGILIFRVSGWRGATGHATLWDGGRCGDSCYFVHTDGPFASNDGSVKTSEILYWELK